MVADNTHYTRKDDETIHMLLEQENKKQNFLTRIMVKKGERITIVRTDEVRFFKSQGKYVEIHTSDNCHLIRRSLQSLQEQLDPKTFFHIHRSNMVNINLIKEPQTRFHSDYNVVLKDGTQLKLSRRYSHTLLSQME